jgi:lipid-A-disaccharide synthase
LTFFVASGEASGETHLANLVHALRARRANLRFVGFGGERLRAAGVDIVNALGHRAGIGLLHGLRGIPAHAALSTRFVECLDRERPAACIFLDNPGFHLVLATLAKSRGVPAIQYVCPQIWAWAPWRWRRIRRDLTTLLAILPFEPPYFESRGIPVDYVGHPIGDEPRAERVKGEDSARPRVVVFAGSRPPEVRRHAPSLARVTAALAARDPSLRFVFAFRDAALADLTRSLVPAAPHFNVEVGPPERWLDGARLAIVKSGTGSLEAARRGVPIVVYYRIAREIDRVLSRALLTVQRVALLNLLANREIVPEVVYVRDDEEVKITEAAWALLTDEAARRRQLEAVDALRPLFDAPGASARAAEAILRRIDPSYVAGRRSSVESD